MTWFCLVPGAQMTDVKMTLSGDATAITLPAPQSTDAKVVGNQTSNLPAGGPEDAKQYVTLKDAIALRDALSPYEVWATFIRIGGGVKWVAALHTQRALLHKRPQSAGATEPSSKDIAIKAILEKSPESLVFETDSSDLDLDIARLYRCRLQWLSEKQAIAHDEKIFPPT